MGCGLIYCGLSLNLSFAYLHCKYPQVRLVPRRNSPRRWHGRFHLLCLCAPQRRDSRGGGGCRHRAATAATAASPLCALPGAPPPHFKALRATRRRADTTAPFSRAQEAADSVRSRGRHWELAHRISRCLVRAPLHRKFARFRAKFRPEPRRGRRRRRRRTLRRSRATLRAAPHRHRRSFCSWF